MAKTFNHDEYLKDYKKRVMSRLTMDMKKEKRDEIQRHADRCGETLTGYIKKAVEMRMAMDDCGTYQEEKSDRQDEQEEARIAARTDSVKSFGVSIGDGGKAAAERNRKQGRIVKDGEHGFMVVYAPEEEDSL